MPAAFPPNPLSPTAVCAVEPDTGVNYSIGAASYTGISTNGTTVVRNQPGILWGMNVLTAGASSNTLVIYDGTSSSANVLMGTYTNVGTGSFGPGPSGVGVICLTGITVVSATGTAAVCNVLWD
jgi:hypothetical protein